MDRYAIAVFLSEARRQATHAEFAASDIAQAVKNDNHDRLWYSIHSLLIALGNLSKLTWPTKKGDADRGVTLRALLHVPEDSSLQGRQFRNDWEHYDERLDEWAKTPRTTPDPNDFIGPTSQFPEATLFLRAYDPETQTLSFRGEVLELAPILPIVDRMRQVADEYGYEAASGALDLGKVERVVKAKGGEIEARKSSTWPA